MAPATACWAYRFTVLTPSYNRAHTLERVYRSLCAQTVRNFEWVVVDDGSTDETRSLIQSWQGEANFPIVYHWQPNQHKKTAFNTGVRLAQGELIVALDSDDSLLDDALSRLEKEWLNIPAESRHFYVAVVGLCQRPDGQVVGDRFPEDPLDVTSLDLNFQYKVRGEKFGCLNTMVLRQFPFPEHVSGFVPESLVWRAIARAGFLTRFVNQVFRVYYDSADSLSNQGRHSQQHALGLWLLAQDTLSNCMPWFRYAPVEFLKAAARYTRFRLHCKATQQTKPPCYTLKGITAHLLVALMWPVGWALYMRDKRR
ncbi:glycosyltransferase family 2 protein [Alcaligenaceae bacterium 429]|uniref:glycosyltransferase family 2 protein n=1 Tax=Paenalcaligenes sp. Me52 TaxID=3392038 RepID=UPI001091A1BA|nr:glycosyltransferase family 2 protein [Alcaligenaceae bacterium 429]